MNLKQWNIDNLNTSYAHIVRLINIDADLEDTAVLFLNAPKFFAVASQMATQGRVIFLQQVSTCFLTVAFQQLATTTIFQHQIDYKVKSDKTPPIRCLSCNRWALTMQKLMKIQTTRLPIGWARQNAVPLKFDPKKSEAAFLAVLFNFDECLPEVVGDVTFSMDADYVGMDVCVEFGNSKLNIGRIIRLFAGRTWLCTFVQYLIALSSQREAANDLSVAVFMSRA